MAERARDRHDGAAEAEARERARVLGDRVRLASVHDRPVERALLAVTNAEQARAEGRAAGAPGPPPPPPGRRQVAHIRPPTRVCANRRRWLRPATARAPRGPPQRRSMPPAASAAAGSSPSWRLSPPLARPATRKGDRTSAPHRPPAIPPDPPDWSAGSRYSRRSAPPARNRATLHLAAEDQPSPCRPSGKPDQRHLRQRSKPSPSQPAGAGSTSCARAPAEP